MKVPLIIGTIALVGYLVFDQRPLHRLNEAIRYGSVSGVDACIAVRASIILDLAEIRRACVAKHQRLQTVYNHTVEGWATFNRTGLQGEVSNATIGVVITKLRLAVHIYDAQGNETVHDALAETWILPNNTADFATQFEAGPIEQEVLLGWCDEDATPSELITCRRWGIEEVWGLKF